MIHAEVAGVDPFDISAVAACEHLNAVINETLRLWPVAATTVVRQSPPEGFHVGNTFIPGNCNLVAPRWTISKRAYISPLFHLWFYRSSRVVLIELPSS